MLANKVIIYDDSCPMCKLYTYWFVAWGFLEPQNRIGFGTAPQEIVSHVDLDRGRHEIPLFDRTTNETIYGLSALTYILGSKWTWLRPIFRSKLFWLVFYPLYQIITFNRRVIAGCKHCDGFDCAPDLNRFYRSIYLAIASLFVLIAMTALASSDGPAAMAAFSLLAGFGLMTGVVTTVKRITSGAVPAWNYIGNNFTILFIAATLCVPIAWIPQSASWILFAAAAWISTTELIRRR